MGCSSSKSAGVAPEPKLDQDQSDKLFKGPKLKEGPSISAEATAAATTAVQSIAIPSCAATPRELVTTATGQQHQQQQQPAAKAQQQQPDPEFDYDLPPNPAAAIKSTATPSGLLHPLGSTAAAGSNPVTQSSFVFGGLLCRQPDWLRDGSGNSRSQAAGTMTVFSNAESGGADCTGSNRTASTLPPIGRGLGACNAIGNTSRGNGSLPPLAACDPMKQSNTSLAGVGGGGAASMAMAMELPAPRRLTGNLSSKRDTGQQSVKLNTTDSCGVPRSDVAAAAAAAEQHTHLDAPALQQQDSHGGLNAQSRGGSLERSSSASSRSSSSGSGNSSTTNPEPRAVSNSSMDPSNPWSALQSHVGAAGPPSPDSTMIAAAAGPTGHRKLVTGGEAGVLGTVSTGAGSKHMACEANELVLEDPSDSDDEASSSSSSSSSSSRRRQVRAASHQGQAYPDADEHVAAVRAAAVDEQHTAHPALATLQSETSASSSYRSLRESTQNCQGGSLTAERSAVKAGGWGKGSLAAAGTLMLGDNEKRVRSGLDGTYGVSTAAIGDDVFGGDSPRQSLPGPSHSTNARQVGVGMASEASSSSTVGNHPEAAAAAGVQQEEEMLGVEEIDDVEALIEAELAAKNALPSDLAAKLAAFEAIADDDD